MSHCDVLYINDLLIFPDTFEDYLKNLEDIPDITENGLKINPTKCEWIKISFHF